MQHWFTRAKRYAAPALALVVALFFLVYSVDSAHRTVVYIVEDVFFSLSQTPERAYAYGARHFDALHSALYDLNRAKYFFSKVAKLNPTYPLLNHQLARIAFLEGDFTLALYRINREIDTNPDVSPSSYYVRGLIKGFAGEYGSAAEDYEVYLESDPNNWAAINDYAWVLLKAEKYNDAFIAIEKGLEVWPNNPWLLNSAAIALYEMQDARAKDFAEHALESIIWVTEEDWRTAYPGNDPLIAKEGLQALRESVMHNVDRVSRTEAL